jgi:2-polyprenyl-3-methyl-5-hydroxy-6-metoxy-1,4-benzoquinol methylase
MQVIYHEELLADLGIIDKQYVTKIADSTRDRSDISVYKCNKSGVIFLDAGHHIDRAYYQTKEVKQTGLSLSMPTTKGSVSTTALEDSTRRKDQFKSYLRGKKWVDIGTGTGEILGLLAGEAKSAVGIEPSQTLLNKMIKKGLCAYNSLDAVEDNNFDTATLFHVLEHFTHPLEELKRIHTKLKDNGQLIVEVPHANDFLIKTLDSDTFKKFTFWSEHLVLHNRFSLERLLSLAGFSEITIVGYQRYSLSNHLHWLAKNKPGGHDLWSYIDSPELKTAYLNMLTRLDQTDTIIAICKKPQQTPDKHSQ